MNNSEVVLHLQRGKSTARVDGVRVLFSAHQCFSVPDDAAIGALGNYLATLPGLAFYGDTPLLAALLAVCPSLVSDTRAVIVDGPAGEAPVAGLRQISRARIPSDIKTIFLTETRAFPRMAARRRFDRGLDIIDADILAEIAPQAVPARAWTPVGHHIYPMDVPEISFEKGLDLLLLDCPARNLALMPNGLAYVHNAIKKTDVRFQTFDLDIVAYHRFHITRLFDEGGTITLGNGRVVPEDPWQAEHYDLWSDEGMLEYMRPILDEAVAAIIEAKPKVLGLSVHGCNESFSRELARQAKERLPGLIILVGGFSCYNANVGFDAFPEGDYMCISEADLTVGALMTQLAADERPYNQPGVISKFDTPDHIFIPGPMPHNLDLIDFPQYEWFDLSVYRNFNDYQLTPVIASRGCRWSRCTFCAERFFWRIRTAENFVDELEWLVDQGCTLFMFNESDLNGMPERVIEICDEIIRRGLKIKLTGQLRIHKKSDRAFFGKLSEAGFVALRFGVDAFSKNALRLQKKGYTPEIISQNLKDCWEAGIFSEINWVIGVPGETDADVDEGIELIVKNKPYIGRLANINPLILSNGSVYWLEPEKHNIRFRGDKDELFEEFPRALPADRWYSEEPFIDAQVRKDWFERIVLALHDANFDVGAWANRIIEDVKLARDRSRSAGTRVVDEEAPGFEPDSRESQRKSRPAMRAASALEEETAGRLPDNTRVIQHDGQWIAYDKASLSQAFTGSKRRQEASTMELPEAIRHPRTPLAKVAAKLPPGLLTKLVRAYRAERSRLQAGPSRTDSQVIKTMFGGLSNMIKGDLKNLMRMQKPSSVGEVTYIGDEGETITRIVGKNAVPEMMCSIAHYNIISFDGRYYSVPQGIAIIWEEGRTGEIPEVLTATTVKEAINATKKAAGIMPSEKHDASAKITFEGTDQTNTPEYIQKADGYVIMSYEGWYYGIPNSHADIDLTEVDPMDIPNVISDVSCDVVIGEIQERASIGQVQAAH
jgi:radical SAM superfamily enzyme YgiQ (UPF0313 family)